MGTHEEFAWSKRPCWAASALSKQLLTPPYSSLCRLRLHLGGLLRLFGGALLRLALRSALLLDGLLLLAGLLKCSTLICADLAHVRSLENHKGTYRTLTGAGVAALESE